VTPAARIAAAVDILADFATSPDPVERRVDRWFRTRRFAGSKDRRAVREIVFSTVRNWGAAAYAADCQDPRMVVATSLLLFDGHDLASIQALFGADRYAPPPLEPQEVDRLACAGQRFAGAPRAARCNYPAWLEPELVSAFGNRIEAEMRAFMDRAPLDLRVNTTKTTLADAIEALASERIAAEPTPLSPLGLRCASEAKVTQTAAYRDGLVEIQDEASQVAALVVGAKPGERIVDYCAGAGGKSLAMASAMANSGRIFAFDLSVARLEPLGERARRAGAAIIETHGLADPATRAVLDELSGSADRVLVDAPCSGTGTWRRAPDARWRLTPDRLADYCQAQSQVMREAAALVRPGGRLVYVTCSILPRENGAQVEAFLSEFPGFAPMPTDEVWRAAVQSPPPAGLHAMTAGLLLTPHTTGTDGFFMAVFERDAE
jgi:16S rRNA (cytosine967-C5)-methyltransferase